MKPPPTSAWGRLRLRGHCRPEDPAQARNGLVGGFDAHITGSRLRQTTSVFYSRATAEALRAICDLDLSYIESVEPAALGETAKLRYVTLLYVFRGEISKNAVPLILRPLMLP